MWHRENHGGETAKNLTAKHAKYAKKGTEGNEGNKEFAHNFESFPFCSPFRVFRVFRGKILHSRSIFRGLELAGLGGDLL